MNKRNRGFRQAIKENEVDGEHDDIELAQNNIVKDLGLYGLASKGGVTPSGVGTCDVDAFFGYDKLGRRVFFESTLGVNFTNDSNGDPTVPSAGQFRWITLVARHGYLPSDARTDGNGDPFNYVLTETISETEDSNAASAGKLQIVRGNEAGSVGAAVRPSVAGNGIIIADLVLNDTGAVEGGAAGVSYSRVTRIPSFIIVPYNSLNSYSAGQLVLYTDGEIYMAVTEAKPGTAPTDQTAWKVFHTSPAKGVYGEPARAFRNVRRQRVSGYDHFGFRSGHVIEIDETWIDKDATTKTATGSGSWFGKWNYRVNNGGGIAGTGIQVKGPDTDAGSFPWGPNLAMNVFGQSVDAAAVVELAKALVYMQQASIIFEGSFSLDPGGGSGTPLSNTSWAFGFSDGGVITDNSVARIDTGDAVYNGAFFFGDGSTGTWYTKTNNGSDPGETANTGVSRAANSPHFFKIVIQGTSAGDFGTAKVLYFLDGTTPVRENMISFANFMLAPFFRVSGSQGEVMMLRMGPCRLRARLALNDEFGP